MRHGDSEDSDYDTIDGSTNETEDITLSEEVVNCLEDQQV